MVQKSEHHAYELIFIRFDSSYNYFRRGLFHVRDKLEDRSYLSIAAFVRDLGQVFNQVVHSQDASDEPIGIPGGEVNATVTAKLKATDKDKKNRARRILKMLLPDMIKAAEHEADLAARSRDEARLIIEKIVEDALQPPPDARQSAVAETVHTESDTEGDNTAAKQLGLEAEQVVEAGAAVITDVEMVGIAESREAGDMPVADEEHAGDDDTAKPEMPTVPTVPNSTGSPLNREVNDNMSSRATPALPALSASGSTNPSTTYPGPLTPPDDEKDSMGSLAQGGIPWYLAEFDPVGTTIHDEHVVERETSRGISEELSELDDDVVNSLLDPVDVKEVASIINPDNTLAVPAAVHKKKAKARKRRHW